MITNSVASVQNLAKSKGGKELWSGLSFEIERGEQVAITGASGAGKTTLLNCLGLLEAQDSGSLAFDGQKIRHGSERARTMFFRDYVGFVFQNYALVESWSVAKNLGIALTYSNRNRATRSRMISSVLERFDLAGKEKAKVYTLSGGEQQRIALARLILKGPRLILADEPLAALDSETSGLVTSVLDDCCNQGSALVFSTHDPSYAATANRAIHLSASSRSPLDG